MIDFDDPEVSQQFEEAFGKPISELTVIQMWWMVKFAKHVRGRCRSNTALNNYLRRNFKHLDFTEVEKINEKTGEKYDSLEIKTK